MKRVEGAGLRHTHSAPVVPAAGQSQPTVLSAIAAVGLVDDDGAAAFFGCSKRTLSTFMGADWMPKPIQLGARLRRWSVDELRAAVARMPRQTESEQPESLLRARIERAKSVKASPPQSDSATGVTSRKYRSGVRV